MLHERNFQRGDVEQLLQAKISRSERTRRRQQRRVDDALLQRGDQGRYFLQVNKFHIDVGSEAVLREQHMSRDIGGRAFVRRTEGFAGQRLDVRDVRFAVERKDESINRTHDVHGIRTGEIRFQNLRASGDKVYFAADQRLHGLVGRNVREIDIDAILFEHPLLLRDPEVKRVGGDDAVNRDRLGKCGVSGEARSEYT